MKDVIIIGGGPAGVVCGSILQQHGIDVLLLERDQHPRHHIGESMQPATFELLELHLGVKEKLKKQGYANKFGAVYIWGEDREPWSILFDERLEARVDQLTEAELLSGGFEQAWQVHRSTFDAILFEAAVQRGLKTLQRTVHEVCFEKNRAVGVRLDDGSELRARLIIDATGQRCLLGRQLRLVEQAEDLQSVATYAYYRRAGGLPPPLGRHVQYVVSIPEGWIWFIPISEDLTSIGVVTQKKLSPEHFEALLQRHEIPLDRAERAELDGSAEIRYARDWSYSCSRFCGPGYILIGDAACFVDPILSGGIDFAIRGGANAAMAVLQSLADPSTEQQHHQAYERRHRQEYKAYLRMARYWYGNNRNVDGFFWQAWEELEPGQVSTPLRAFVYLTSGNYAADKHFKVFEEWQEQKMFTALGADGKQIKQALRRR